MTSITEPDVTPHVAVRIEPGAILCSSWGYDQTNVDYYLVTRTTAASAWIVRMPSVIVEDAGPDSEYVVPGEPIFLSNMCECGHKDYQHLPLAGGRLACTADDYRCRCAELWRVPMKPRPHRILRGDPEGVCISSARYAWLWNGKKQYASHYA
jgi:hypothetical protein